MKIDIVYPVHSRLEYTSESMAALGMNTEWDMVNRFWLYLDESGADPKTLTFATAYATLELSKRVQVRICRGEYRAPVAIMREYAYGLEAAEVLAKIDNDVIVSPGWLGQCIYAWRRAWNGEADLLGIEPPDSRTPAPWARGRRILAPELAARYNGLAGAAACDAIGGVGLMRTAALRSHDLLPHSIYGGFTDWQQRHVELKKGWIVPPLKLFLLDRMPGEPWATLSAEYIRRGYQRPWTNYTSEEAERLAGWWQPRFS